MYTTILDVRKSLKGIDSSVVPDQSETEFSVEHAITKADRIIDANLSETFIITEPVPDLINELSTELAVSLILEFLYSEENGGFFETANRKYKRCLETLKGIVGGTIESGLTKKETWGELWIC